MPRSGRSGPSHIAMKWRGSGFDDRFSSDRIASENSLADESGFKTRCLPVCSISGNILPNGFPVVALWSGDVFVAAAKIAGLYTAAIFDLAQPRFQPVSGRGFLHHAIFAFPNRSAAIGCAIWLGGFVHCRLSVPARYRRVSRAVKHLVSRPGCYLVAGSDSSGKRPSGGGYSADPAGVGSADPGDTDARAVACSL